MTGDELRAKFVVDGCHVYPDDRKEHPYIVGDPPEKLTARVLAAIRDARFDERHQTLRELAKKECMWCATPVELQVSIATMRSGDGFWIHHKDNSLGDHDYEGCDAGVVHDLLREHIAKGVPTREAENANT